MTGASSPTPEIEPEDDDPASRPVREGLPAHYRMRAEPHYVETLARPRREPAMPAPTPVSDPRATMNPGMAGDTRAPSAAGRAVHSAGEALARALQSINASLAEVRGQGRPLRERMLLELARAEAIRAGWLADAVAVLHGEPLPRLDAVNLRTVIAAVAEALGPEQRITGQSPTIERDAEPVTVFGDERLLTVSVGAMIQAMCAALDGHDQSDIAVRVTSLRDGRTRGVEVSQTAVRLSAATIGRLFDTDWPEHPAGATGAVLLAAARRIAQLQGGALEAQPLDDGGCRLVVWLPAADAR